MQTTVTIRNAQEKDLDRIMDLLIQVNNVHAAGRPDLFIEGKTKYTKDDLKQIITNPMTPVYVGTDANDEVLGYAFCMYEITENENNRPDHKTLYIDDICVDEKSRGQKVATQLFEYVKQVAKKNGCLHITLNVWTVNPNAYQFYEAMGMKPLKTMLETVLD